MPKDAQERRRGPDGGAPDLYLRADFVAPLRAAYSTGQAPDEHRAVSGEDRAGTGRASDIGAAGWQAALAESQALAAQFRADLDTCRSQLESVTVARDVALRRAEEAERACYANATRLESLRATVALWYAALRRPLWRLRPLPALPAEVTSTAPALAKPGG